VLELKEQGSSRRSPTTFLGGSSFDVRTCVDVLMDIYTRVPSTVGRKGTT
jgi:hypothetical protein